MRIIASYATGKVSSSDSGSNVGGLVGSSSILQGQITYSYWDTEISGQFISAGGIPKRTSELQSPGGYRGIYARWNLNLDGRTGNDNPWDFGTNRQYPVLRYSGLDTTAQFAAQPSDADLDALSFSPPITLRPAFTASVITYTADVTNNITALTVTARARQTGARVTIRLNNSDGTTAGRRFSLAVGINTITVMIAARSPVGRTTTKAYTVTVTRAQPPGVRLSKTSLRLNEGEANTYTLTPNTQPTGVVTVSIVSNNADVVATSSLTFNSRDWNTARTVTVQARQDDDISHDTARLSHRLNGYGTATPITAATVVRVKVIDDDTTANINGDPIVDDRDALILFYAYTFSDSPAARENLVRRLVGMRRNKCCVTPTPGGRWQPCEVGM